MGRKPARMIVFVVSLGLAGGLLPATSPAAKPTRTMRVGLVDTLLRNTSEPMMQIVMRPFKALLEAQTGMSGQLMLGGDALALGRKLKEDEVQVGVFHGFEFAWARQKYPTLKPVVIAVNRYRYLEVKVVVRADCKATSCADLEGKVAALPIQSREHSRLFFERRCTRPDVAPARFYSQITSPNDPEDALDDVVDGKAQLTVVDGVELEYYKKVKPGRARQLKNLLESEPFPCAVIAYQPGRVAQADVARFRSGLIAAKSSPRGRQLLQLLRITGFEAVPPTYDASLAAIAKLYPPPAPAGK